MRRITKMWLITAACLILIGCILFTGIMTILEWDFMKLSTVEYETNTYEIKDDFNNISINTNTTNISFVLSDDNKCKVECHEPANAKHSATVKDDTLSVDLIDERSVYSFINYIGLNFGTPKITVFLTKTEFANLFINGKTSDVQTPNSFVFKSVDISLNTGNVDFCASASEIIKIKTSTGNICTENISAGSLDLTVSTGKVDVSSTTCDENITVGVSTGKTNLENIQCKSVLSSGNTGDITLNSVIATDSLKLIRSTGDIKFNKCDAKELYITTDTGDVNGSLLSDKVFVVKTDTGKINVPETESGGKCEITTDTGDVKIVIEGR